MTTERSGMSLDEVYRKIDWLSHEAYENDMSYAGDELARCAESLKEHLSRDAVVSAMDRNADVLAIQKSEVQACPRDDYMRGLYNGMLLACCNIDNVEYTPITSPNTIYKRHAVVPAGYVLVPVEPTEAMLHAGRDALNNTDSLVDAWEDMLAQRDGGN